MTPSAELQAQFGAIDIYLFDQLLKGSFDERRCVLDAGCGSGRNLPYFLQRGFQLFAIDSDPWGHSIQKLVMEFPQQNLFQNVEGWLMYGAYLDRFYIPTRYPNGLPDLTPSQVYSSQDSTQAIEKANFFLEEARKLIEVV